MIVRCDGTEEENEAYRALLRISGRCKILADSTFHWQSSHPDNPRMDRDRVWTWITREWQKTEGFNPKIVIPKEKAEEWDREKREFDLWYCPEWPTDQIAGKALRPDGSFRAADRWISRLIDSIKKHGIRDPILAWNHVPSQRVIGRPEGSPNVILGSNRVAVAQHLNLPSVPLVVSYPKNQVPPWRHTAWSLEDLHDRFDFDLWVTRKDWYPIHPPTRFHDEGDDRDHELDFG